LCIRVKNLGITNLRLQYLNGTWEMILVRIPNNNPIWWDDIFYSVHTDMKSHTGDFLTSEKGGSYIHQLKQAESQNKELY